MREKIVGRWRLLVILAFYLLLTVGYSVVNPLFESPDEHFHFFTAHYIAQTGKLPIVSLEEEALELYGPEPAQPPLYYLLAAALTLPIEYADAPEQIWLNPYAWIGTAEAVVNVNRAVQTPLSAFPWSGYALAAHVMRVFSAALGLGTLLCVYGSGRLLWPNDERYALLATGMVAFLPQFNFLHASISNDPLAIFFCSLGIWQLLRVWLNPEAMGERRPFLVLGVTIGLAALSKNAGILLFVYAMGVLTLISVRSWAGLRPSRPQLRVLVERLALTAVPVLLLAGWLWVRNYALYGDVTAANQFVAVAGGDRGYSLWQVLRQWQGLWMSSFAVFGWFNLLPPVWVYWVWNGIAAAAAAGAIWRLVKGERGGLTAVALLCWPLLVYAGLVLFMLKTPAAQGRLLFPAIVPLALGLAYGLRGLPKIRYWLWLAVAGGISVYCLLVVIRPAYALSPIAPQLPPTARPLDYEMGSGLRIMGAETVTPTAVPGGVVEYIVYWQTDAPPQTPPELKVEIFGFDFENPDGESHSYHGRGLYPASLWPAGAIVADRTLARLDESLDAPLVAQGFVRLASGGDAESKGVNVGEIKIVPAEWPTAVGEPLAVIGDEVGLTAVSVSPAIARPGDTVTVTAQWEALATPTTNYATLIHLAQEGQPPLANGDNQPRNGRYPTGVWEAGEVINDQYQFTVPQGVNGRYPVWIGMYDLETLTPLPLWVDGKLQGDGRYLAGWVEIRP